MKKSRKNCFCFWLLGAATAASTGKVLALEASDILVYSHGPLSLRPQLGFVEQFNDNIFYAKTGKESDFITTIAPGLNFQVGQDLPTENHIKLSYTLDELIYAKNSSQNA